jgi:hypothetical protein
LIPPGRAEDGAGKARNDLLAARPQQIAHQRESPLAGRSCPCFPIEDCRLEGICDQRIGNVVTQLRIGGFELGAASLANRVGKIPVKVAEEGKRA